MSDRGEQPRTPLRVMFDIQQSSIEQGQQIVKRGLDVQRTMAASLVRNNLQTGRVLQQQQAKFAQRVVEASVTPVTLVLSDEDAAEVQSRMADGFDEYDQSRADAWESFERSFEEALDAYGEMTAQQKELVEQSVQTFFETQHRLETQIGEAIARERRTQPAEKADTPEREESTAAAGTQSAEDRSAEAETGVDREAAEESQAKSQEDTESGAEFVEADLDDIHGIGRAYSQRLEEAGVESVGDLAGADATAIARELDVSENRAQNWIDAAADMLAER